MPTSQTWDIALLILASPVYLLIGAMRLARAVRFVRISSQESIACPTCGETILLVGFWRCNCGFTYRGHLVRLCPVCRTLPDVIRCEHCEATERIRR